MNLPHVLLPRPHRLSRASFFSLGGASLVLKPNGAQDLGLVLHELATNASKYGALSSPTGRVLVTWSVVIEFDRRSRFQNDLERRRRTSGRPAGAHGVRLHRDQGNDGEGA